MARKKWTDREKQAARLYRENGLTDREIADFLGRSWNSVKSFFSYYGIEAPKEYDAQKRSRVHSIKFTPEEIEAIRKDFEEGEITVIELCAKYHFTTMVLYKLVDKHGFKPRKTGVPVWRRKVKIIPFPILFKMYHEDCMKLEEIAKHFGVNRRVVTRSIDKHGLERINQRTRLKIREEFSGRESVPKKNKKTKGETA